jgi:hypothetical protein
MQVHIRNSKVGDGLWKGRNDRLAYERVKKGRREGGKEGREHSNLLFFGGGDCSIVGRKNAQRLAFPQLTK